MEFAALRKDLVFFRAAICRALHLDAVLGWFMSLWALCPSLTCACWYVLATGSWAKAHLHSRPLGCLAATRASPLALVFFGFLPPWFPFCSGLLVFRWAVRTVRSSGRGATRYHACFVPVERLRCRCSWRAFVAGCCFCCGCPLVLRCLFGGSSDQSSLATALEIEVFCQSAIESAEKAR